MIVASNLSDWDCRLLAKVEAFFDAKGIDRPRYVVAPEGNTAPATFDLRYAGQAYADGNRQTCVGFPLDQARVEVRCGLPMALQFLAVIMLDHEMVGYATRLRPDMSTDEAVITLDMAPDSLTLQTPPSTATGEHVGRCDDRWCAFIVEDRGAALQVADAANVATVLFFLRGFRQLERTDLIEEMAEYFPD